MVIVSTVSDQAGVLPLAGWLTVSSPVCAVALMFLDFYLRFIEGIDDGQFSIRRAEWMISCGQERTPGLFAQVYDLTTCINLAYTMLTAGQGKAVR